MPSYEAVATTVYRYHVTQALFSRPLSRIFLQNSAGISKLWLNFQLAIIFSAEFRLIVGVNLGAGARLEVVLQPTVVYTSNNDVVCGSLADMDVHTNNGNALEGWHRRL